MITGEITIHDEPIVQYQTTVYNGQSALSPEEKEKWLLTCAVDLEKAKQLLAIGDRVSTTNVAGRQLLVIEFVNNIQEMQRFQGHPCVVRCKDATYQAGQPIQYSLFELNLDSIVKAQQNDTPDYEDQ